MLPSHGMHSAGRGVTARYEKHTNGHVGSVSVYGCVTHPGCMGACSCIYIRTYVCGSVCTYMHLDGCVPVL